MSLGPFDLRGGAFLELYAALLVLTVVSGFLIPRWLQPEGRTSPVRDPERLAWLVGGLPRFADAVVARLLASGAVSIAERTRFHVERRNVGRSEAERAFLALPSRATWKDVERTLGRTIPTIRDEMVAAGLAMDARTIRQMRVWQTAPYLMLLAFGAIKWEVGTLRDRPVESLTGLMVVTAVLAVVRLMAVNRRTRAGDAALARARTRSDRLRRAPTSSEVGLAVALFGTVVLAGSPWAAFHHLRRSGGSDSGDGDGGGCGGGGCGGCGG